MSCTVVSGPAGHGEHALMVFGVGAFLRTDCKRARRLQHRANIQLMLYAMTHGPHFKLPEWRA